MRNCKNDWNQHMYLMSLDESLLENWDFNWKVTWRWMSVATRTRRYCAESETVVPKSKKGFYR